MELVTKFGVETTNVLSSSVSISGGWKSTYGLPHNSGHDCSGTFSTLAGVMPPISVVWNAGRVSASAAIPGQNDCSSTPISCANGSGLTPTAAGALAPAGQPAATIDLARPKPVTRPFHLSASDPQDTVSLDATFTANASDCTTQGVLASTIAHSPGSKPLRVQAFPATAATVVSEGGVRLRATASDGCAPYMFAWQLVKRAAPKYVAVTKVSRGDDSIGRSAIYIKLECNVPRKIKRAKPDGWLDLCAGPIGFEVDARDSSHPRRTGHDFAAFKWEPRCLSPAQRDGLKRDQARLLH